jgi:hypothetical protein
MSEWESGTFRQDEADRWRKAEGWLHRVVAWGFAHRQTVKWLASSVLVLGALVWVVTW